MSEVQAGSSVKRALWVVETRTRVIYPKYGTRRRTYWGKWSAWRPYVVQESGEFLTKVRAREIAGRFLMTTEQFRVVRYTP